MTTMAVKKACGAVCLALAFSALAGTATFTGTGSNDVISDASHWGGVLPDLTGGTVDATISTGSSTTRTVIFDRDVFFNSLTWSIDTYGTGIFSGPGQIAIGPGGIADATTAGRYIQFNTDGGVRFTADCTLALSSLSDKACYIVSPISCDTANPPVITKTGSQSLWVQTGASHSPFNGTLVVKQGTLALYGVNAPFAADGQVTLADTGSIQLDANGTNASPVLVDSTWSSTYAFYGPQFGQATVPGVQRGKVTFAQSSGLRIYINMGRTLVFSGGAEATLGFNLFWTAKCNTSSTIPTVMRIEGAPWKLPGTTFRPYDAGSYSTGTLSQLILGVAGNEFYSLGNPYSGQGWYMPIICTVEKAFDNTTMALYMEPYGSLDLGGHNQSIGHLVMRNWSNGGPMPCVKSTGYATLSVKQSGAVTLYGVFEGKAGLRKSGSAELTLEHSNTSQGDLYVAEGGVTFTADGSWPAARNVTVTDGARLTIATGGTFGANTRLRLNGAGTLVFSGTDVVTQEVATLQVDGNFMPAGLYSAVAAEGVTQDATHLSGTGVVRVLNDSLVEVTDGVLTVAAGETLVLERDTLLSDAVTAVVVEAGGRLTVNDASAFASGTVAFTLDETARLGLAEGVEFRASSFVWNGNALEGTIGAADAASDLVTRTAAITGGGTVFVRRTASAGTAAAWTAGGGADTRMELAANWGGSLPDLAGGTTIANFAAGTGATANGAKFLNGVSFTAGGAFSVEAGSADAVLRIGSGGISLGEGSVPGVYYRLDCPVRVEGDQTWTSVTTGSDRKLTIADFTADSYADYTISIDGSGQIFFLNSSGRNEFNGNFVLNNGMFVLGGHEPAGTNGEIEVRGGRLAIQAVYGQAGYTTKAIRFTGGPDTSHLRSWITDGEFAGPIYYSVDFRPEVCVNGKMVFSGGVTGTSNELILRLQREDLTNGSTHPQLIVTNKPWTASGILRSWGGDPGKDGHRPEVVFAVPSNRFASIGRDVAAMAWNTSDIRFGADWAFYHEDMPVYVCDKTTIDLAGTRQQFGTLKQFDAQSNGFHPVVSNSTERAGTLYVRQTADFTQQGTFGGNLNLSFGGTATTTLSRPSTAVGTLEVTGGTLAFTAAASWQGATNVAVRGATSKIALASGDTFCKKATLALDDGGKIEIAAGVTQQVLLLQANGMPRPNGRYTAASHPDLVSGGGTLRVDDGNGFAIMIK